VGGFHNPEVVGDSLARALHLQHAGTWRGNHIGETAEARQQGLDQGLVSRRSRAANKVSSSSS